MVIVPVRPDRLLPEIGMVGSCLRGTSSHKKKAPRQAGRSQVWVDNRPRRMRMGSSTPFSAPLHAMEQNRPYADMRVMWDSEMRPFSIARR
jgi:hypothetical protein